MTCRIYNPDRVVLSPGHGSMLLHSLLHLTGYDVLLEQIRHFREWGGMTTGHPERDATPGYGAPDKQDSFESYGSPLGVDEVGPAKLNLGWPVQPPFYIPERAGEHFERHSSVESRPRWSGTLNSQRTAARFQISRKAKVDASQIATSMIESGIHYPRGLHKRLGKMKQNYSTCVVVSCRGTLKRGITSEATGCQLR